MKRLTVLFLIFGLLIFSMLATPAMAYTEYSTNITSDTTWGAGTHYVSADISVDDGVRLTVSAGAVVKFAKDTGLIVYGILDINGASGSEVVFTSIDDDSYGDIIPGSDGSPSPGFWDGIYLYGEGDNDGIGEFDYCRIRYGGGPAVSTPTCFSMSPNQATSPTA